MKTFSESAILPDWLEIVKQKVETLSYGVVQIVVHERKVTHIERTEKTRLDPLGAPSRKRDYE